MTTPFDPRIKSNAKLRSLGPTKVPAQNREKLEKLIDELEPQNISTKRCTPSAKSIYGTTFLKLLNITPEKDTIKVVLNARHVISNTDQAFQSWL